MSSASSSWATPPPTAGEPRRARCCSLPSVLSYDSPPSPARVRSLTGARRRSPDVADLERLPLTRRLRRRPLPQAGEARSPADTGGTAFAVPPFMKTNMNRALLGIAAGAALLAACETGKTSDDLVGTWQRMRDDLTVRDQYVFRADGTLTFDEFKPDDPANEDHVTGTYTATDDTIVLEGTNANGGGRARGTVTYYANATMFATQALRPAGAHTGIVGEWFAIVKSEYPDEPGRPAEGGTVSYQFRSDGTFTGTINNADGTIATEQG